MGEGVYAVAGGKGGVGKTTTAINLGVVLGQAGYEVAVVDADLAMPDVGRRLHVDYGQGLHSVLAEETPVREAVVEGPGGIAVIPGDLDLASFGSANPDRLGKVLELLDIAYDVVLVDTAPGLQNETVVTYRSVDGVVLVTTPDPSAVADVEKTGRLAADVGTDRIGTVVTRGESRRTRRAADRLEGTLLGVVPRHSTGGPVTVAAPEDPAADAYRQVAAALPAVDATTVAPDGVAGTTEPVEDEEPGEDRFEGGDDAGSAAPAASSQSGTETTRATAVAGAGPGTADGSVSGTDGTD
jgi:septum site-determining protein MinD